MQCPRCNATVEEGNAFCPYCGYTLRQRKSVGTWPIVALASAGIVYGLPFWGLIFALPAFVLSLIGLAKSGGKEENRQGYWMAFWALVANSLALLVVVVGIVLVVLFWPEILHGLEELE